MTGHVKAGLVLLVAVGAVVVGIVGVQALTSGTPEPAVGEVVEVRDSEPDPDDQPTTAPPTTPAAPRSAAGAVPLPAPGEAGSGRAPGLARDDDDDDDRFEDSPSQPRDLRGGGGDDDDDGGDDDGDDDGGGGGDDDDGGDDD